jgi:hypothetical protein
MARMASACGQPSKTELGAVWFRRPMLNQRNALLASRLSTLPTTATARAPRQDAPRSVNSRRRNGARVHQGYHVFERLLPGLGLTGCVGSRKAHACRLTPGIGMRDGGICIGRPVEPHGREAGCRRRRAGRHGRAPSPHASTRTRPDRALSVTSAQASTHHAVDRRTARSATRISLILTRSSGPSCHPALHAARPARPMRFLLDRFPPTCP